MSHGLVTLFKYPTRLRGLEAVTLLRYTLFAMGTALLLLAGPAAAFATPFTIKREFAEGQVKWSDDQVDRNGVDVEEYCPPEPYRLFCVGPYHGDPIESPFEETGVRVAHNDTLYNVTYDNKRHHVHGPYTVELPAGGDDLHVCYFRCMMPYPLYAKFHANTTIDVKVNGEQIFYREDNTTLVLGHVNGTPLPPPYGCETWERWCE
jgi:hypothetical protein